MKAAEALSFVLLVQVPRRPSHQTATSGVFLEAPCRNGTRKKFARRRPWQSLCSDEGWVDGVVRRVGCLEGGTRGHVQICGSTRLNRDWMLVANSHVVKCVVISEVPAKQAVAADGNVQNPR